MRKRKENFVMRRVAITTSDNPFDPFDDFASWYNFDEQKGYRLVEMLGRITSVSDELPERDQLRVIEESIDLLVLIGVPEGVKKIVRD